MRLFRIFNTPKNQRFEYKPRHWDPQKEELHKRLDQIEKMKQNDPEALKARIAQNFRRGGKVGVDTRTRQKAVLRYNLVLLGIIAALGLLTYIFLVVYLPDLANALGS